MWVLKDFIAVECNIVMWLMWHIFIGYDKQSGAICRMPTHVYIYIYKYKYIEGGREGGKEGEREREGTHLLEGQFVECPHTHIYRERDEERS